MNDKLDDLSTEIDDAVLSAEDLKNAPGGLSKKKIDEVKDALEKAQDVAGDLENEEE